MRTIWGFDLGVTSVGFAVVRWDEWASEPGAGEIVRLGVRIFPESRDNDLKPLNASRRRSRLSRRTMHRRRWRRRKLRELLAEAGLLPDSRAEPPGGQDPVLLRQHALCAALLPHELGWAIFHLLKRRGASGSRKYGSDSQTQTEEPQTAEEKEAQGKRDQLRAALGDRILVEHLASIRTSMERPRRRRDQGLERGMIEREFGALWCEQHKYHPSLLTSELREQIEAIAFRQRPTFFRRQTIGYCDLERGEERALKADWPTQHFEMLQLINDLRVEGGNLRPLDPEERARAQRYLQGTPEPPARARKKPLDEDGDEDEPNRHTWAGLRAAIKLGKNDRFTHERDKQKRRLGNATEIALRTALGPDFPDLPAASAIRSAIAEAWHLVEYRQAKGGGILEIRDWKEIACQRLALADRAEREWGLSREQAEALSEIKLPHGTGRHSLVAMQKMIRLMEAGMAYAAARKEAYPQTESGPLLNALPGPNAGELASKNARKPIDPFVLGAMESLLAGVRNPTVLRTLSELQKVVNKLLRKYGRPDLIRIELARALKKPAFRRLAEMKDNRDRDNRRRDLEKELAGLGKPITYGNVLRLSLLYEQNCRSPYSGESISCAQALDPMATEIDHIIPLSRSPHDNGQGNKVLCFVRENRSEDGKGQRTPYEWLRPDKDKWAHLTKTVWREMVRSKWPRQKRDRCLMQEPETEDQFTHRQLTDSSFIATAARAYLGLLFGGGRAGETAVQAVPAQAMAQLRRGWGIGLGQLLHGRADDAKKPRDDHRHHAVDALVVALTGPGSIHTLSCWWQARENHRHEKFRRPWPAFHADTKTKIEAIVVSHRVQAKLSGALHDELPLGLIEDSYAGGQPSFVIRKKVRTGVGGLSAGEIDRIVDGAVKDAIRKAVAAAGGDLRQAFAGEIRLPSRNHELGPVIRRVRVRGPKQNREVYDEVHRKQFKTNQALHSIALVRRDGAVVFEIRLKRDGPTAANGSKEAAKSEDQPIFLLCRGDMISRVLQDMTREIAVITDFYRNGQIFFTPHWYAGPPLRSPSRKPPELLNDGWRKVAVDPIGQCRAAR